MTKYTEKSIFDLLYDIRNMTRHEQYNNIFELASVIETLQLLIRVQVCTIKARFKCTL